MSKVGQTLPFARPAPYQITVPGHINKSWSDWDEGITIAVNSEVDDEGNRHPLTILIGILDPVTLQGFATTGIRLGFVVDLGLLYRVRMVTVIVIGARLCYTRRMEIPLLQTKFYIPPARSTLVLRPRLMERLNVELGPSRSFTRKLTLISAPAGFGKTTLVSSWIGQLMREQVDKEAETKNAAQVTWLSLDEGDNDLTRFLTYVVSALQMIETNLGKGTLSVLRSPQLPAVEGILTTLLNEIATIPDQVVLILDDYHLIESQSIHNTLAFLIRHLPPQLHLVITTREDPPWPLARLRARGQLTELRATDLRFSSTEATEFLNQVMGLDLPAADIATLETRTEGWIAGLQLAAISMQGHEDATSFIKSFTGSHHFVLDYLVEEVLEQQSESVQTFLLKTSILNRLTGSLCDAVCSAGTAYSSGGTVYGSAGTASTDQYNGQATLEMLEQSNLFIVPLDEERRWYRYHHLFADLLRQRLQQKQPDLIPTLHIRASEWYKRNGFVDEAIEHALRGEYFERAATLIEAQFGDDYERGDQTLLRRWLNKMPESLVFSKPSLCLLDAWNLFSLGQLDAAARRLQVAENILSLDTDQKRDSSLDESQLSDINRMSLAGQVAVIQSFLVSYSGDIARTIHYARQALAYLPEQELAWRSAALMTLGDAYASQGQMTAAHKARSDALALANASDSVYIRLIVNLNLADTLRQQGKLQQVIDICERQLKKADESGISESALVGWLLGIWGEVLAELNHLDKAINQARKSVELAALGRDVMHIAASNLYLVRVLFSSGDIAEAENVIQSLRDSADEYDLPFSALRQLSVWQVRIWLARDKLEAASQWAKERALDPAGELAYPHEMEYIVFARILIAQGRLDEATSLLRRLLEAAEAGSRTTRMIETLMLQALAFQAGGDTTQSMDALERALALAEPNGFIRIFVDEGPSMAHLLYDALKRGIAPNYVRRLLAAFPVVETEKTPPSTKQASEFDLIEPLSEREIEVLHLIAKGLTNQKIASQLFLSLNTIKAHIRNIYGKLSVHNRAQAITQAQRLGLL